jgi:hypothetical protein
MYHNEVMPKIHCIAAPRNKVIDVARRPHVIAAIEASSTLQVEQRRAQHREA